MKKRKSNRLNQYDYSRNGAYFITICVNKKQKILSKIIENNKNVGANSVRPLENILTCYGKIVEATILNIENYYSTVKVDKYVIMPNHIHIIISIDNQNGRTLCAPTISTIVKQMKESVTKQIKIPIFQKSFYDHIIRNESDYKMIWDYIDTNPLRWELDCFYK